jgi:hypothetical protein
VAGARHVNDFTAEPLGTTRNHPRNRLSPKDEFMPLLRSRTAARRARFNAVVRLYAALGVVLALLVLLLAGTYFWNSY